jgi:fluoroquinolone transport system permease protein
VIARVAHATRLALLAQTRARFLYVYAFVTLLVVLGFRFGVPEELVPLFFPVFLFTEPGMVGTTMVAAQRYLEKGERSLSALLVTPLRPGEYVAGLVLAAAIVGTGFGALAFVLVSGLDTRVLLLVPVLLAFSVLSGLLGFALAMRYREFTQYIVAGIPFLLAWQLPLLAHFEIVPWPALLWMPPAPALAIMAELMRPGSGPGWLPWLIACACLFLYIALGFAWVNRSFVRRVSSRAELA